MATLRVLSGPAGGQSLELEQELVIGRENADLTIEDPELSRRHAAVRPAGSEVEVEDLGSLNGTFVDGRRIDTPVKVSGKARIRLGTSELEVDIPVIASPDVTAPRQVPKTPEVTAPQQIPQDLDLTAERPIPQSPDVTAPRKAPAAPDVTAPRRAPATPEAAPAAGRVAEPEVTAQRPVAPTPPPAAPPSSPAPAGREPGRRPGPPVGAILGVLLLVAAVAAIVLLAAGGDATEQRTADAVMQNTFIEVRGRNETVTGVISGEPFESGSTRIVNRYPVPPLRALPGPTEITSRFTFFFAEGTMTGTGTITMTGTEGRDGRLGGRFRITDGTDEFEGAEGTLRLTGTLDGDANPPRTEADLKGNVEY